MKHRSSSRRGMTLVELLVVVTIAVVLVATSVPLMRPALQDARVREASRQLNVFAQVARSQAIETGRTTGIYLERASAGSNAVFVVHLAQTPLPYSGDFVGAQAISFTASVSGGSNDTVVFDNNSAFLPVIVEVGDVIKFNYKGHSFPITAVANSPPRVRVNVSTHSLPPNPTGLKYQVFRKPKKSLATPLQLSGSTVIDLQYSGIGATTTYNGSGVELSGREFRATVPSDTTPVVIAFNSSGAVDHVSYGVTTTAPSGMIHLLIGRNDAVGELAPSTSQSPNPLPVTASSAVPHDYTVNVASPDTVWLTINPKTGAVSSAENAWAIGDGGTGTANFAASFANAREFAQSGQSMGGL